MRIVTVLNSRTLHGEAPEFLPKHVYALRDQCAKWAPGVPFEVISDKPVAAGWHYTAGWPGWWLKMALFDPDIPGDFLFMDLDTVITGPLDDILAVRKLTLLRDFYRDGKKLKEGLGGGLIYLPEADRAAMWDFWNTNPALNMRLYARGDQHLFERLWLQKADRWQDVVPGQVVSWKVHCKGDVIPPDARIVCMHGKPRPWEVGKFLELYR